MKWAFLNNGTCYRFIQNLIGGTRARQLAIKQIMNLDLSLDQLSILDIGCGVGDVLKWIPRKWEYTGIDVTESYIKLASAEWGHRGRFMQGDASQIDTIIPPSSQDIILFLGVLHHLDFNTATRCLMGAKKCLKKTGFVFALEPAYWRGQTKISQFTMSLDRGAYIRELRDWYELGKNSFRNIKINYLPNALRIPYHKITIRMSQDIISS